MMMISRILAVFLSCAAVLSAAEVDLLREGNWIFTDGPEFTGAKGEMKRGGTEEAPTLMTVSDFSDGGNYTGVSCAFPTPLNLKSVSLTLRSPAKHIGVQVVDATNQTLVRFVPLSGNFDQIQSVTTDYFFRAGENGCAKWGGANDGVLHLPVKSLTLRTIGASAGNTDVPQKIEFLSIKAETTDAPVVKYAPQPDEFRFCDGAEFPGAKGALETLANGVKVHSDFSGGGNYLGTELIFSPGVELTNLSFQIKTPIRSLMIEVTDSQGQNFHQLVTLSGNGTAPQRVDVRQFAEPDNPKFGHWGGANDGVLRQPISRVRVRWLIALNPEFKAFDTEITDMELTCGAPVSVAAELEAQVAHPGLLVVPPGSAPVRIGLKGKTRESALHFQLRDYVGNVIGEGRAEVTADGDGFLLPVPEKIGFVEYVFENPDFTCGMVVSPKFEGERDDFFGVDAAASVFGIYKDPQLADGYYALLEYAGIGNVRERLCWGYLEPKQSGVFDWDALGSDFLRSLAARHHLKVLDVFHDAPAWSGAVPQRNANGYYPYPRDLIRAAATWKSIGERWKKYWNALEVWNEPEIAFGAGLPGDQLMALQRTISYEFARSNISTPLVSGVFTGSLTDDDMMRTFLANGLLADADIMSFHNYELPEALQSKIAAYRAALRNDPKQALPFWITECGKPWPRGTARAAVNDDIFSAVCIAMKAVEAKANGIAMFYPFILQYYDENLNNFGMIDGNHTPMRSLAAYVTAVRLLSHFRYAGDLNAAGAAKLNRVFVRGDEAIIVCYTGESGFQVELPEKLAFDAVLGIDGRELSRNRIQTPADGMFYVVTTPDAVKPFLNTETEAMRLLKLAESYKPIPRVARPVVFQYEFDRASTSWTNLGYLFSDQSHVLLPFKVNNLADETLVVKPEVILPEGARLLSGAPAELSIPARSAVEFRVEVDFGAALASGKQAAVELRDNAGNAEALFVFARNWNLETAVAEPLPGTVAALPSAFDELGDGWIKLEGPTRWRKWDGGHLPNIRGAFRVFWKKDSLCVEVVVEDPVFDQPYGLYESWRADSVQLALQTLGENNQRKSTFTEITAARTGKGDGLYRHSFEFGGKSQPLETSKLTFRKIGEKLYSYTIVLDAKELQLPALKSGLRFGFALLINSSEGNGRDGYLYWGDGIGVNKNPREFNLLELK